MLSRFQGHALITGGNSGFGLEFAQQLAAEGYNLVLVARDQDRLNFAQELIEEKYKVEVFTISQDLTQNDAVDRIIEKLTNRHIHIGLLINNAGLAKMGRFHEISLDLTTDFIKMMCLNVTQLTHRLLPNMLEKNQGGVIFVSSIAALFPGPFNAVYSATKSFELQLAISLHGEYKNCGIDVLAICPGSAQTNIFSRMGMELPKEVKPLSVEKVVKKTLEALGHEIVLSFPNDTRTGLAIWLSGLMSYRLREISILSAMKRMWGYH